MNVPTWVALAGTLALSLPLGQSDKPDARQYYSKYWQKQGGYYYLTYYYMPTPGQAGHRTNYVIYYASRPRYFYYYNPAVRKYWGRFDREERTFSRLAPDAQRERLADIPDSAFPKGGAMPAIPDSSDGVAMAAPRGDCLPPEEVAELPAPRLARARAVKNTPRQLYSDWCKTKDNSYFCCYYVQLKPDGHYTAHRCYYYPRQPRYIYYYNPEKGKYWGRYDLKAEGYSLLAEKDRKSKLADIPDEAFPKPGSLPAVPGAEDGLKLERPPKELPE